LTVPLATLCYLAADPIVHLLFVRGAFSPDAARDGALMLRGYAPGLPAVSACFLLTGAFFATGDSMTPSLIRAAALTVNVVLNFALLSRLGLLTIPISYSIAYLLCLAWMSMAFRRRGS
jgi:putative peptidoglycan lipid II flippase